MPNAKPKPKPKPKLKPKLQDPADGQPHPPQASPEDAYGEEGTNKTQRQPDPNAKPSDQVPGVKAKFIPPSPYNRG